MKKNRQISQRIKAFREKHYPSQKAWADALGLGQTVVSAWERGPNVPSCEAWIKIASLAPSPDNLWFLEQAGLGREAIVAAAKALGEINVARPKEGEIVLIPRFRETEHGREKVGSPVPLQAEFIPNSLTMICLSVDEKPILVGHSPRGLFIVDTSIEGQKDLSGLWGRFIVIRYLAGHPASSLHGTHIGRLMWRAYPGPINSDLATVSGYLAQVMSEANMHIDIGHYTEFDAMQGIAPQDRLRRDLRSLKEFTGRALSKFRMHEGITLLGEVVGWLTERPDME